MDGLEVLPENADFKLIVVGHDDGSYSALICIEGFEDHESACEFCDEFLDNGTLEVGDVSLLPEQELVTVN
jgi:hypothetical protein